MDETVFEIAFLGTKYQGFYIKDPDTAAIVLGKLMLKDCLFSLDCETAALPKYKGNSEAALSPHLSQIRLLQVFDGENSFIFDCFHIPVILFSDFLRSKKFIAHNALFDLSFIRKAGIEGCNMGCTMLAWIILYHAMFAEDDGFSAKLVDVTHSLLGTDILKHMQRSDWSVPELTYEQILYAGVDAICVLKIAEKLSKGLEKQGLINYYNLCKKALHPISEIQLNGVKLDTDHHRESVARWRDELVIAKKEVLALTGLKDITAHNLAHWLEKNLPPETLAIWPRTEKGKLKTDSHAFSEFGYLDIVEPFARYQKKQTLCSTFGITLFDYINQVTGRIHSSYFLLGARTGRLSSRKPNGQNFPRDASVRSSFIAEKGNVFVCSDFSQVELRCSAEISQDQTMLKAYREGIDLHRLTASKISHKKLEDVTSEDRQMAKAINFGLLFGLGPKKFSHYAKKSYGVTVSEKEAHEAVNIFRETYAQYRTWQINQATQAEITKRCVTPMGKWRTLPDDQTYGNSLNHPIQGAGAEIMICSLIRIFDTIKGTKIKLVNTVHDEILLECPENLKFKAAAILKKCMVEGYLDVFPHGITRDLVEAGAGKSWVEAKSKENVIRETHEYHYTNVG